MTWQENERQNVECSDYEFETWLGRQISEYREMGAGYCGSCSLQIHVDQCRGKSWRKLIPVTLNRQHKAYLGNQHHVQKLVPWLEENFPGVFRVWNETKSGL